MMFIPLIHHGSSRLFDFCSYLLIDSSLNNDVRTSSFSLHRINMSRENIWALYCLVITHLEPTLKKQWYLGLLLHGLGSGCGDTLCRNNKNNFWLFHVLQSACFVALALNLQWILFVGHLFHHSVNVWLLSSVRCGPQSLSWNSCRRIPISGVICLFRDMFLVQWEIFILSRVSTMSDFVFCPLGELFLIRIFLEPESKRKGVHFDGVFDKDLERIDTHVHPSSSCPSESL